MPWYDYTCSANGRTLEVNHGMDEVLTTWGELCERSGKDPGTTAADAPIVKELSTGTTVEVSSASGSFSLQTAGCGCGRPQSCGNPIGGHN